LKAHAKKVARIAAGIGLILIGIVGLILPVMPGWIFIIPGLVILSEHFDWAKRLTEWLKSKFAEARKAMDRKAKDDSATIG
jgi:uncharacterized membrane protein YbaN (DUF454 family)